MAFPGTVAWRSLRRGVAFSVLQGRAEGWWSSHCSLCTSFLVDFLSPAACSSRSPSVSLKLFVSLSRSAFRELFDFLQLYLPVSQTLCFSPSHTLSSSFCPSVCLPWATHSGWDGNFIVVPLSHFIKVKQTSRQKLREVTWYSAQYHEFRLFFGLKWVFTTHFCQCIIKKLWLSADRSKKNIV